MDAQEAFETWWDAECKRILYVEGQQAHDELVNKRIIVRRAWTEATRREQLHREEYARNLVQSTLNNWKAQIGTVFDEKDFGAMQQLIDHTFQKPCAALTDTP